MDEKYHVPLEEAQREELDQAFQHMNVETFLTELFECIFFQITIKKDVNAEDYVDNAEHE